MNIKGLVDTVVVFCFTVLKFMIFEKKIFGLYMLRKEAGFEVLIVALYKN